MHRSLRTNLLALAAAMSAFALLLTGAGAGAGAFDSLLSTAAAADAAERSPLEEPEAVSLVRLRAPGIAVVDELLDEGLDVAGNFERVPEGVEIDALVTAAELEALADRGVTVVPGEAGAAGDEVVTLAEPPTTPGTLDSHTDAVTVGRIDYFTTKGQGFLSVEAKSNEGTAQNVNCNNPSPTALCLYLSWDSGPGTELGSGGTVVMSRYHDSGVYMYHRILTPVDGPRPHQVLVTSTRGGQGTGYVSDWLRDVQPLTERPGYQWNFIDSYMHPTQLYDRMEQLAEQYPGIAEIVELPHPTGGYQRQAMATIGSTTSTAVVVRTHAWGHEGGNDVTVQFADPGAPSQPLSVEVDGTAIRVNLATNASGSRTSSASQVAAALRTQAGDLVHAHTYRGNSGNGVVAPAGPVALTDFLSAPSEVPRGQYTIKALRIGKNRDGSKPGVLIVAQDHAREWVPPVVAQEAMERLLHNYATDVETRKIVNNTDIFIVPSNNPDGSHYSFFDFASQRKNMTNHCADNNADPGRRNTWGVDLNRNYRVGSGHDGYSGASTNCTTQTYQGPEKLSEPEAQNVIATVEANPNIKFFMTIHSNGGQLFWQPGAYIAQGRITTPRPEMRDESFYWQMADRILSHVKAYQDTVVRPDNVGGSADVLYSSAGNVREDLYNNYGIYAFGWEVGGSVWNPNTRSWQGGSFQPNWVQRGHGETMEYANGIIEMFRIAAEWGKDFQLPVSELVPGGGTFDGPVEVVFETSEAATVYYTTDGSKPTLASARYLANDIREPGQRLLVAQTTTFHWFSVDTAGNVERNYKVDASGSNYRKATITIADGG